MNDKPPHLATGRPAQARDFILERRARLVADHLPETAGAVLDYGCGNGAQTIAFVREDRLVVGVDVDRGFLDEFGRVIAERDLRASPLQYDGKTLPVLRGVIDTLVSFEVLEHVPDERAALAEMRRVLKPDGRLVLTVPNRWWLFETHGANLPLLPWNRVPFFGWLPKRIHDRYARARNYTRGDIVRLLIEAGFCVSRVSYVTAPMDVLRWHAARRALRATLFAGDTTRLPVLATAILVVASPATSESS